MLKRKRDYLFKRPNLQHWRVRLQMGGRSVEKSLGTPDRAQAEIIALPLIAQHKAKLLEARPRLETSWQPQYEPGREHVGPEGRTYHRHGPRVALPQRRRADHWQGTQWRAAFQLTVGR